MNGHRNFDKIAATHVRLMADRLIDSDEPSVRESWRRKFGLPEDVATDPRPIREIYAESKIF